MAPSKVIPPPAAVVTDTSPRKSTLDPAVLTTPPEPALRTKLPLPVLVTLDSTEIRPAAAVVSVNVFAELYVTGDSMLMLPGCPESAPVAVVIVTLPPLNALRMVVQVIAEDPAVGANGDAALTLAVGPVSLIVMFVGSSSSRPARPRGAVRSDVPANSS